MTRTQTEVRTYFATADQARQDWATADETFVDLRSIWISGAESKIVIDRLERNDIQYLTGKHPVAGCRIAVALDDWPRLKGLLDAPLIYSPQPE